MEEEEPERSVRSRGREHEENQERRVLGTSGGKNLKTGKLVNSAKAIEKSNKLSSELNFRNWIWLLGGHRTLY